MLHLITPIDRIESTLKTCMSMVAATDRAQFVAMLRVLRTGIDCAYHEAGAPYGIANGWGMMRWVEEVVNGLELEEAGLSDGAIMEQPRYHDTA